MPTILAGLLPPPHQVGFLDGTVVRRSTLGRMPWSSRPDPTLNPRRLALEWADVVAATAVAIRNLYDENPHAVFVTTLPGTGESVRLQLVGPPNIQWASVAFASRVTAEAEEVLAYE